MKRKALIISLALAGAIAAWIGVRAADEITINAYLAVNNGEFSLTRNVQGYRADQTGESMSYGVAAIDNTTNTLAIGADVTIGGYSFWRNVGTNTVWVEADGSAFMKLLTNDVAILRVSSTNLSAYVADGSGLLEYWVNEQ